MRRRLSLFSFRRRLHGAAYVEYLLLLTAVTGVSMGALFTLLPWGLQFYNGYTVAHNATMPTTPTTPPSGGTPVPTAPIDRPPALTPTDPPPTAVPTNPAPITPPTAPIVAPPVVVAPPPEPIAPAFAPFDFGERTFAWNNTMWRATSPYVDIDGVADTPVAYTVSGDGRPAAQANVNGGPSPKGELRHGTDLQMDVPAPGGTHTSTLHIDGRSGSFRVRTLPIPDQTVHHDGTLWLWIPVHWEGRSFSISGQGSPAAMPNGGNTRPSATLPDGRITHGVAANGFNLTVSTPPAGQRHRVIITIDGHTSAFSVIRP